MAAKKEAKAEKVETQGMTTRKSDDFSEWYNEVVQKAGLADYAPVAGCMVIKPHGYAIWEAIRSWFDARIKATGHRNAYFPMFIPEKFLKKEAEHFKGFTPEVAWVVEEGEQGKERFALRPTSETIIYDSYSKWIRSWRDLPLLLNQWCNIIRWECSATRLFLRTREFLWQEGHTAHATEKEAEAEALMILGFYKELMETQLAVPVLTGGKTNRERFAGALRTYTVEALMPDGKALQMATSHNLGQNFSKPFGIKFMDRDEKEKHVWQTSWGFSTRLLGALAMTHGDDSGLVLPPNIAPTQVVIIPIIFEDSKKAVRKEAELLAKRLSIKFRAEADLRDDCSAGWKFNEWELKGVPLRIEIGPKDIAKKHVVLVRRDDGSKKPVPTASLEREVETELDNIQKRLFMKAKRSLDSRIAPAKTMAELEKAIEAKKMVKTEICGAEACEDAIQEKTTATVRLISENETARGRCVVCGKKAAHAVYVARQY
ncbi:MAG: proline--tRNA ligase [Candidatus Aenigmarchaeota archaeon]|nr:proline--tRNA ligase [Candidatus Aenigmarchaeota archaeon]